MAIGLPAWMIFDSFNGIPISRVMVSAISSARALRPSWILERNSARLAAGVAAQPSQAARAERMAASASFSFASGMLASSEPSVGQCTAMESVPAGSIHLPSRYNCLRSFMMSPPRS